MAEQTEQENRATESDLIYFFMYALADAQQYYAKKGYSESPRVPTSLVKKAIRDSFEFSEEDKQPLTNRKDTKIDQVMRNLVSHNVMKKHGLADHNQKGWKLTEKGKDHMIDFVMTEIGFNPDLDWENKQENQNKNNKTSDQKMMEKEIAYDFLFTLVRLEHKLDYETQNQNNSQNNNKEPNKNQEPDQKVANKITTSIIKDVMMEHLPLNEEDKQILNNRKDTRAEQIIRNLVSHKTLERQNLASYQNGSWHSTEKAKDLIINRTFGNLSLDFDYDKEKELMQEKKRAHGRKYGLKYKNNLRQFSNKL